jgi:hypothetical protein
MKYTGPLRVISNTDIDKIGPYINLGRTQIGMQKSANNESVKAHYRSVTLPDGTIVETWYSYMNHTCKVTVPDLPSKPLEIYVPGIIMMPIDDSAVWGYTNPEKDQLGNIATTRDSTRYGSSLLVQEYEPGTTTYSGSIIVRPWKQPTIDPKTATKSYKCGTIAYPIYNNEDKDKYLGNVVFPYDSKGMNGMENWQPPFLNSYTGGREIKEAEEILNPEDGYMVYEHIKETSIKSIFYKGIPVAILGEDSPTSYSYIGSYYRDFNTGNTIHDFFHYLAFQFNPVSATVFEGYFEKGNYNFTEEGKYLADPNGLVYAVTAPIIFTKTIANTYCIWESIDYGNKGIARLATIEHGNREFSIIYSHPAFTSSDKWNTVLQYTKEAYEIDSDNEGVTLLTQIPYPPIEGTSISNIWPAVEVTVPDVSPTTILSGKTYKNEPREVYVSMSNISLTVYVDEYYGFYNIDYLYTIPDGLGNTIDIPIRKYFPEDPELNGLLEHLLWIEFNPHCDVYVYAIVSMQLRGVTIGLTLNYQIDYATITLYRNGEEFYSYSKNDWTSYFGMIQLPWLGPCTLWESRKIDQQFFGYVSGRIHGQDFFVEDEGVELPVYFDAPAADFFTYWCDEVAADKPTYYKITSKSVIDPGKDPESPNVVTVVAFKDLVEGEMDNPDTEFKYFMWWNNEIQDVKTIEEMLLIDAKENPRVTNFGVI